jgi:hypothetical protein
VGFAPFMKSDRVAKKNEMPACAGMTGIIWWFL